MLKRNNIEFVTGASFRARPATTREQFSSLVAKASIWARVWNWLLEPAW